MFDFEDDASRREKCFTTVTELPTFVDPKQIPSKKVPFSTILNYPFVHTVSSISPVIMDELWAFQRRILTKRTG